MTTETYTDTHTTRRYAVDELTLYGARTLSGLLAGVYFCFAVAIMPALHRLDDATYATVMNHINEVIVNPVFLLAFLGAPALTAVCLAWNRSPLAVAAAALGVAAMVVTFAGNIPLNDALADGGSRSAFENPWLVWHGVRTAAAIGSFALLCRASA